MSIKMQLVIMLFVFCEISSGAVCAGNGGPIDTSNVSSAFNPEAGVASISYTLGNVTNAKISLTIANEAGDAIRTMDAGRQDGGQHNISWDGTDDYKHPVADGRYQISVYNDDRLIDMPQFLLVRKTEALPGDSMLSYYSVSPATDPAGNIYVTDGRQDCVWKYDRYGNRLSGWGSTGDEIGQFHSPSGIAIDSHGNVYVVDTLNDRVQKFSGNGSYIAQWGSSGTGEAQFNCPSGIAIDSRDRVYVTDTRNHRVQVFDDSGRFTGQWGSYGSGPGQFNGPSGIAVDAAGNVLVADTYNNRIEVFDSAGNYLDGKDNYGGKALDYPTGIAVTGDGNLLVEDRHNQRVMEVKADGILSGRENSPDRCRSHG